MILMKWMFSVKFWAGAAAGYVLGARAGREQYDRIMSKVSNTKEQATAQARDAGAAVLDKAKDTGADVIDQVKEHSPFGPGAEETSASTGRHASTTAPVGADTAPSFSSSPGEFTPATSSAAHTSGRGM